jgi:hypothetical protein
MSSASSSLSSSNENSNNNAFFRSIDGENYSSSNYSSSNNNNNNNDNEETFKTIDRILQDRIRHFHSHMKQLYAWDTDLLHRRTTLNRIILGPRATQEDRSLQRESLIRFIRQLNEEKSRIEAESTVVRKDIIDFKRWVQGKPWTSNEHHHIASARRVMSQLKTSEFERLVKKIVQLQTYAAQYLQELMVHNRTQIDAAANVNSRHLMRPEFRLPAEKKQSFKHAQRHQNYLSRKNATARNNKKNNAQKGGKRLKTRRR